MPGLIDKSLAAGNRVLYCCAMASSVQHARLTGFFILIAVVALDQWSKAALIAQEGALPRDLLPFFRLVLVRNHGISFGLLGQMPTWLRPLLTVFTSCIALGLLVWLARTREKPVALTLGLVIGGALGNIIDRLRMGGVTDFLDFHVGQYHWPAFNLADSAVCMGVVILVLMSIVSPSNEKEKMK